MKFISNNCIAIHLAELNAAEIFYRDVLGFKLKSKTADMLEFDTGHFLLYVNKDKKTQPLIPSFTVENIDAARTWLIKHKCRIIREDGKALYFQDPFGVIYDIIEQQA